MLEGRQETLSKILYLSLPAGLVKKNWVTLTYFLLLGVAPFSGATTGTGGRIRDVQAAGRGAHVVAGTAGYCFGNLHIPGED